MSKTPNIVPSKFDSPINYKIIGLIIGAVILFRIIRIYFLEPDSSEIIISIFSLINPLAAAIAGFVIAKRYFGTQVFGKAYLTLAVGFFMIFLGEVTYAVYDLLFHMDPYPSIADVFFFSFYPLAITHLLLNIKFFKTKLGITKKIMVALVPITITLFWISASLLEGGELNFDFFFGLIFIIMSSTTLSFSLLGASIFKDGLLGKAWLVLLIGMISITIGDTWYYYLEIFDEYDLSHPINMFWYVGYWILVYALVKHKDII